ARPDLEVVEAVAGRGVHEPGARVVGDMLAIEQRDREVVAAAEALERMVAEERNELVGRDPRDALIALHLGLGESLLGQIVGEDVLLAHPGPVALGRGGDLVEAVCDAAGKADGAVAGNGPRRRGPDDDRGAPM